MKLYSKEGQEVMEIRSIKTSDGRVEIKGQLMKSMPMTIHVRPTDLADGARLLSLPTIFGMIALFFKGLFTRREKKEATK